MKKFLFVLLISLFLSTASIAKAEDKTYYCYCYGTTPITCTTFTSTTLLADNCPTTGCSKPAAAPLDVTCAPFGAASVTSPSTGGTADSGKVVKLSNPLAGDVTDVNAIIGNVIKTAMGVMGALVLLMIIWGGTTWLWSAGNPEKVKAGSNMIMWAILGAIVVLASYMLLTLTLKILAG